MTNTELKNTTITNEEVEKLWTAFNVFDKDANGGISAEELGLVMRSLGQSPDEIELRDLIKEVDVDLSGTIDFEEFKALMVSKQGDRVSRFQLAFSVFDENNSGEITADEMRSVMNQFGLTDEELDEMVNEIDHDGDGSINFEEFCKLIPEESETNIGYKDSPILQISLLETGDNLNSAVAATNETTLQQESTNLESEVAQLSQLLAKHPTHKEKRGTSRLQMQIGMFRLLQGAAYRCFRESFSAHHETHLRVRNLPYRITDFVQYVKKAIELYKRLGIASEACNPVLDAVVQSITEEYARLEERIKNWKTVQKTPEMLAEQTAMLDLRGKSASVKQKFAAGVEFAITLKKKKFTIRDIAEGVLAINELNRLRKMEITEELAPPPAKSKSNPLEYLKKWNRVVLSNVSEEVDGAMMPVSYWYEDFMPKLLAAFSVTTEADIQSNTIPDEAALNQWYESVKASGEFSRYGADVAEGFANCTPKQKLMLKQAWQLTHHYLNGVQKRREREEFGRDSGALSQYVAFIDAYIGRSDVENSQMRLSFPYYLGPAVWRFFHTTAEIVSTKTPDQQTALVAVFKEFFELFASMYPCPYCRHHLNMYVVQNKEVEMYPVEYLLLGRDIHLTNFEVSLEAKLSYVVDGPSLRLFLWKLHNTVSSSIARSEEWYHRDEKALYTTRYWPSLDSELAQARALKYDSILTDSISRLYGVIKPASRLAGVRTTLQKLLEKGDHEGIKEACIVAQDYIKDLESALESGNFLQETYYFNPELVDQAPHFTPEEEAFARSGMFVEIRIV
ncbi:EF-hand domain-containing protein [Aetokthonos hydrillicola Thurmond2011]|jgi:Ca2+-binding EF-hand superfamily protein|uniref:thiol oxidase n=1 Tax=Aetokthonos hydrillicola Thurmond2011 TaxID=2712845 RepID=A0AAP5IDP6_9CYAN|nr:EF-hand domain-containing protein [Aetokthonos hydrillicola]MBO3458012.1 histidine kinase [Aetokthonos hydrillicola CCALA 1050]MBW4587153.1 EF-hand domain-containing protein [Aetokthonos hydrillicola CCALA 1050]MDR9899596.1 EF-hand domain-containing protein [Aetokthonos hydrillicola Thurmond2011]